MYIRCAHRLLLHNKTPNTIGNCQKCSVTNAHSNRDRCLICKSAANKTMGTGSVSMFKFPNVNRKKRGNSSWSQPFVNYIHTLALYHLPYYFRLFLATRNEFIGLELNKHIYGLGAILSSTSGVDGMHVLHGKLRLKQTVY